MFFLCVSFPVPLYPNPLPLCLEISVIIWFLSPASHTLRILTSTAPPTGENMPVSNEHSVQVDVHLQADSELQQPHIFRVCCKFPVNCDIFLGAVQVEEDYL